MDYHENIPLSALENSIKMKFVFLLLYNSNFHVEIVKICFITRVFARKLVAVDSSLGLILLGFDIAVTPYAYDTNIYVFMYYNTHDTQF